MPLSSLMAAGFTPDMLHEAVKLLHNVVATLEIAGDNGKELLCAFTATPEMHDALCAFAAFDDREDDGLHEDDERDLPRPEAPELPAVTAEVAKAAARWLGSPLRMVEAPAPSGPAPMTPSEGIGLTIAALAAGAGKLPRGPAEWMRLQGAPRVRERLLPPPPRFQLLELRCA